MARLATSLVTLRTQVNELSPNRSRASDGWIGDPAHAARVSDHNPDRNGIVHALDITHDPVNGVDSQKLADALVASRDDRIKYIISNRRIVSGDLGPSPWTWRSYSGSNPHTLHVHISVRPNPLADMPNVWHIGNAIGGSTGVPIINRPVLRKGMKSDDVKFAQTLLNLKGANLREDGDFGKLTDAATRAVQTKSKLVSDGIIGQYTWNALVER